MKKVKSVHYPDEAVCIRYFRGKDKDVVGINLQCPEYKTFVAVSKTKLIKALMGRGKK